MRQLCLVFANIALHRRGPDALPAVPLLLGLALVAYCVLGVWTIHSEGDWPRVVLYLVVERALYLGVTWGLLAWLGHRQRFLQTAIALVGMDVLFALLALPLVAWSATLAAGPTIATAPRILSLGLLIWSIDVSGYILARALARPYLMGVGIVLVYLVGSSMLRGLILPVVN